MARPQKDRIVAFNPDVSYFKPRGIPLLKLDEVGLTVDEREAIRLASVYGFDYHVHLNRGFLGYVLARRGDPEEGSALLAEGKEGIMQISG